MKKSLLQQALEEKADRKLKSYEPEEVELAIAWVSGRIQTKQVSTVIKLSPGNTIAWLAARIRKAHEMGLIEIQVKQ